MEIISLLIITFSAFFHAIWNFLLKKSEDKNVFTWLFLFFSFVFYSPIFIYFFLREGIPIIGLYYTIGTGILVFIYFLLLGKSYTHGHLSLVYPLARSASIFVPFWAFIFINERLTLTGIIGIVIILLGVYILHLKSFSFKNLISPFYYIKEKASMFAILTAICISFYSLTSKVGIKSGVHPFIFAYLMLFTAWVLLTPYILLSKKRQLIKRELIINKKNIIIVGVLNLFTYVLVVFTMQISKISYIVSVRQLSIVFGVLLGSIVLKERYGKIRLVASLVIVLGVLLIGIAQ